MSAGERVEGIRESITYLYTPGCHFELFGELISESRIWLGITLEDALQGSELRASSPLPVLDLIRSVWIKRTEVGGDVWRDGMVRMEHMVGVERKAGKHGLIQSLLRPYTFAWVEYRHVQYLIYAICSYSS